LLLIMVGVAIHAKGRVSHPDFLTDP
jgi:hypothetical protein